MISFKFSEEFNLTKYSHVKQGYLTAAKMLNSILFAETILEYKSFTYTKDHPAEVYFQFLAMRHNSIEYYVSIYNYPNATVVGMTKNNVVFINKNGSETRTRLDYTCNALHEFGHLLGYGHGSNFPNGFRAKLMGDFADKTKSVPYIFAEIGKKLNKDFL